MRITFQLSPKKASEYTFEELLSIYKSWGSFRWAANAINVSEYTFKKAFNNKKIKE